MGASSCGVAGARHSGHSGLVAHHSAAHAQQKMCPQGVAVGALRGLRHSAHTGAPGKGGGCSDEPPSRGGFNGVPRPSASCRVQREPFHAGMEPRDAACAPAGAHVLRRRLRGQPGGRGGRGEPSAKPLERAGRRPGCRSARAAPSGGPRRPAARPPGGRRAPGRHHAGRTTPGAGDQPAPAAPTRGACKTLSDALQTTCAAVCCAAAPRGMAARRAGAAEHARLHHAGHTAPLYRGLPPVLRSAGELRPPRSQPAACRKEGG